MSVEAVYFQTFKFERRFGRAHVFGMFPYKAKTCAVHVATRNWPPRPPAPPGRAVFAVAGGGRARRGIYLRRPAVPDEERRA